MATPEALVEEERVPQALPVQPVPERVQVTPLFCESLVTVAVKGCVAPPTCTFAEVGATETPMMGAAVTVMVAAANLLPLATEVAVKVTVAGVGTVAGAV